MNYCIRGGFLVGASRVLPDDETLFDLCGLPVFGCNRVFCSTCKVFLHTEILDSQTRAYSCRCGRWKETEEQACRGFDPDDEDEPYAGVTLQWRCGGHETLRLPTSIQGTQVKSKEDLRALIDRLLRESVEPERILRLHARLDSGDAEVVAQACLEAPDHPSSRALFTQVPKPKPIAPVEPPPPIDGPPDDPRLQRALEDLDFRETFATSSDPIGRYLRAIGAFAHAWAEEIDYTDWNGAVVGHGPGEITRPAIPPDATLAPRVLLPLLERGERARELIARHPATPDALLVQLAQDTSFSVKEAVFQRGTRNLEVDLLLAREPRGIAEPLARSPALAPKVIEVLARHPSVDVRLALLKRQELSAEALAILSCDPDEWVRKQAIAQG